MEQYKKILDKMNVADGILIGASNGFSIAEGYDIFSNNTLFRNNFSDFKKKIWY